MKRAREGKRNAVVAFWYTNRTPRVGPTFVNTYDVLWLAIYRRVSFANASPISIQLLLSALLVVVTVS